MEHDRVKNVINNVNISKESVMQKVTHLPPPPANILTCFFVMSMFSPLGRGTSVHLASASDVVKSQRAMRTAVPVPHGMLTSFYPKIAKLTYLHVDLPLVFRPARCHTVTFVCSLTDC